MFEKFSVHHLCECKVYIAFEDLLEHVFRSLLILLSKRSVVELAWPKGGSCSLGILPSYAFFTTTEIRYNSTDPEMIQVCWLLFLMFRLK